METKAKRLERLREERQSICTELEKIVETAEAENDGEGRSLTEDETTKLQELRNRIPQIDERIKWNQELNEELLDPVPPRIVPPEGRTAPAPENKDTPHPYADPPKPKVPAMPKQHGRLRHMSEARDAWIAGNWMAACLGNQRAMGVCRDNGVELRVHQEKVNTAGGYLVPEQMLGDMIRLVELYGVFPQYSKNVQMTSDTATRPRRSGGLTAYFVGESDQGTESTMSWDQVNLTAKKIMVLSRMSNELSEDAMVSVGDELTGELAYAIADKIDDCGFNGDGTSTYGGIVGARRALRNLSSTRANIAGLVVGTGNLFTELVLTDFHDVVAKLPQYADTPNVAWFCHKTFYHTVMDKLAYAAGGNTVADIAGGRGQTFLGYPVVFSQKMPKVDANDQVACLLGDLAAGSMYGSRRDVSVSFSEDATVNSVSVFEYDEIAVRGTTRFDINVHDVGNASGTAASRVPGPIVGLLMAAS